MSIVPAARVLAASRGAYHYREARGCVGAREPGGVLVGVDENGVGRR